MGLMLQYVLILSVCWILKSRSAGFGLQFVVGLVTGIGTMKCKSHCDYSFLNHVWRVNNILKS